MNGVNFSYSFAPPHRLTLCRPSASRKALIDVMPDGIVLSYTNDSCVNTYPLTWRIHNMDVETFMNISLDGEAIAFKSWRRHESGAPYLFVDTDEKGVSFTVSAIATKKGVVIKTAMKNASEEKHEVHIQFALTNLGHVSNKGWVDGKNNNVLLAMSKGRADKIIAVAYGADDYIMYRFTEEGTIDRPPMSNETFKVQPHSKKKVTPYYSLEKGEERCSYIYLPYEAYFSELESLAATDFEADMKEALAEWERLLSRGARFDIPDESAKSVIYASIADMFVMREKTGRGGKYCINCGTAVYRSSNSIEPTLADKLIDSLGYTKEAASDTEVFLEAQDENGCWATERGWEHEMWGSSFFKANLMFHHYKLTLDREFLERAYEGMYRSSIFQREARRSTVNAEKVADRGLMPRGMGDSGLQNNGDFYGVYYPHNFLTVGADMITLKCAKILGKTKDIPVIEEIISEGKKALLRSVRENAVKEDGYSRIPAIAGIPENSLYGSLYAFYPTGILSHTDPLIEGTVKYIETKKKSEGGLPMGTGWLRDGLWVAMALDNFSAAYLRMGKQKEAREYLYPAMNHASPLVSWCEERGSEAGSTKRTGDPHHLWTPLSIGTYMVDAFFMDEDEGHTLFAGMLPEWLDEGKVGVKRLRTSLGKTDLSLEKTKRGYRFKFNSEREPEGEIRVCIPTNDGARIVTLPASKRIDTVIK